MADAHIKSWLHLRTLELLGPMLVGSVVFAIPSAFITDWIVKKLLVRKGRLSRLPFESSRALSNAQTVPLFSHAS